MLGQALPITHPLVNETSFLNPLLLLVTAFGIGGLDLSKVAKGSIGFF